MLTLQQIKDAKRWLEGQRAVVHPGPIETVKEALDIAEAIATARDARLPPLDPGIAYRARQAKRQPVTAQWCFEHPDVQAYIFSAGRDDLGLDPWVTVAGIDATRRTSPEGGCKIILEHGRTGEMVVEPSFLVFVSEKELTGS